MDIEVTGARILFEFFGIKITEIQVISWIIIFIIFILCIWLSSSLKVHPESKKQIIAEYIVTTIQNFVKSNMSKSFEFFSPFIFALMVLSAFSSLSSLLTFKPPTSDLNTLLGWSILVFIMIIYYKIKSMGFLGYLKSYTKPIILLTPFNILSDIAIPVSMAFRHFGNIVSGVVISSLVYGALASFSSLVLGNLPGFISKIPIFELGLPAFLSIYFDLFSSFLQAFIFCMLTMVYIKMAANIKE